MAQVEKWTQEQMDAYKERFPGNEPKPWVITDGYLHAAKMPLIIGMYDTQEEAEKVKNEMVQGERIATAFGEWVDATAELYGISTHAVEEIVSGEL